MSVLFGILNKGGEPLERAALELMATQTHLPGCRPTNIWIDGCFGFGISQRFETPQDQLTSQPLVDQLTSVHLIATGRLDYRDDLARKLGFPVSKLDEFADVTLMQLAWHKWQRDCVFHLEGDWSLAIWDDRYQRLHLLRDAMGISALHYVDSPRFFAFSTRVDPLLQLPGISREPNIERLIEVLAICASDGSTTGYRDIRRMPPASRLQVSPSGAAQIENYRDPFQAIAPATVDDECFEQFVDIFEKAVEARMRSVGPVGLTISSGFDSSSLAVAANRIAHRTGKYIKAYSATPLDPTIDIKGRLADESPLIRQSCEHLSQIDVCFTSAADLTPVQGIIEVLKACGEPSHAVTNHYWIISLLRQARQAGISSILTGQMGNATISWPGADRRAWQDFMMGDFQAARARWLRQRKRRTFWQTFKSEILSPMLSKWRIAYLPRLIANDWLSSSFLLQACMRKSDIKSKLISQRRSVLMDPRGFVLKTTCGQVNPFWAAIADWVGVSVRDPTADERVAKFCLSLPDSQYQTTSEQRVLAGKYLRNAGLGHVVNCPWKGLQAADISRRMVADGSMVEQLLEQISRARQTLELLDVIKLRSEWGQLRQAQEPTLSGCNRWASWLRAVSVSTFMIH